MNDHVKFGFSKKQWDEFSEKRKNFHREVCFKPAIVSDSMVHFKELSSRLEKYREDARWSGGDLCLSPDFQRGNKVWSKKQKKEYIENVVRGLAPVEFRFNSDNWLNKHQEKKETILCIDGLQRITAILDFMAGKISIFNDISYEDLIKYKYPVGSLVVNIKMYSIEKREDLLQYYLMLNTGGTRHSNKEIQRVKELLDKEKNKDL